MRSRRVWCVAATLVLVAGCGPADPDHEPINAGQDPPATAPAPQSHALGWAPTAAPTAGPTPPDEPEPGSPDAAPPPAEPEPEQAPPPPPPRDEGECIADRDGPAAGAGEVAQALADAAARTYWPTSAPEIRVSEPLLRATAWQESG